MVMVEGTFPYPKDNHLQSRFLSSKKTMILTST